MRASSGALRQCTRYQPTSMHFMPYSWHYISGHSSIQAPRKPQKSAISAPRPTSKLFKFSPRRLSTPQDGGARPNKRTSIRQVFDDQHVHEGSARQSALGGRPINQLERMLVEPDEDRLLAFALSW